MALASGLGLLHQAPERLFAVDQFYLAALQIVIAPIQHFTSMRNFVKLTDQRIFEQFGARAPAFVRHLLKLRLHLGCEMYFHSA